MNNCSLMPTTTRNSKNISEIIDQQGNNQHKLPARIIIMQKQNSQQLIR